MVFFLQELAELVVRNGGRYSQLAECDVTHFVVNWLPLAKLRTWEARRQQDVCICIRQRHTYQRPAPNHHSTAHKTNCRHAGTLRRS